MQKSARPRDEFLEHAKNKSIADSLRSLLSGNRPRVSTREPRHIQLQRSPLPSPSFAHPSIWSDEKAQEGMLHEITDVGLRPVLVLHNLSVPELCQHALQYEPSTHLVTDGALAVLTGAKTGRSPLDKRVVRKPDTEKDVWWGARSCNLEMDVRAFVINRERAVDYLNTQDRLYVVDGYASWHPLARYKVRVICTRPYHALFAKHMLVGLSEQEEASFEAPDLTIYNAGAFPANRQAAFSTSSTCVALSLGRQELVILGTQYAGEMKKGAFSALSFPLLNQDVLPLHASCSMWRREEEGTRDVTPGPSFAPSESASAISSAAGGNGRSVACPTPTAEVGDADATLLYLGLPGTGKTTLSQRRGRRTIGDSELAWGPDGVFSLSAGCHAKVIGLRPSREPGVAAAIRGGAILENVVFDEQTREVDYFASKITENTRAVFPLARLPNAVVPAVGGHPTDVVLLSCDCMGVLPLVAKLTPEQAVYHYLSGYSASLSAAGEGDPREPMPMFSACFGASFLICHPLRYGSLFLKYLREHRPTVWLLNTGWMGGGLGIGYRIPLSQTSRAVEAIERGELAGGAFRQVEAPFNLLIPTAIPGVPDEALSAQDAWPDKEAFELTEQDLAAQYRENFEDLVTECRPEWFTKEELNSIRMAGPLAS